MDSGGDSKVLDQSNELGVEERWPAHIHVLGVAAEITGGYRSSRVESIVVG